MLPIMLPIITAYVLYQMLVLLLMTCSPGKTALLACATNEVYRSHNTRSIKMFTSCCSMTHNAFSSGITVDL